MFKISVFQCTQEEKRVLHFKIRQVWTGLNHVPLEFRPRHLCYVSGCCAADGDLGMHVWREHERLWAGTL